MGISTSAARSIRILLLQSVACIAVESVESLAAEIPARVRQSLEQNAAKLSPISIRWKFQMAETGLRSQLPKGSSLKFNEGSLVEQQVDYKYKDGRYYFRWEYSQSTADIHGKRDAGGPKRFVEEKSFDSNRVYMYSARSQGNDPSQVAILPKETVRVLPNNYFERVGFRIPNPAQAKESTPFVPEVLAMVNDGEDLIAVEKTQLDGKPCLRIAFDARSHFSPGGKDRHEFYLDQETAYTLRRHDVKRLDGTLLRRIVLSDIQRVGGDDGPWLPFGCQSSYYQYNGLPSTPAKTVVVEDHHRVESCELADIPDSTFALTYLRPGMIVIDATLPGAEKTKNGFITYTVPADPADLDRVIAGEISQNVPVRGSSFVRRMFFGLNILLLGVLAVAVAWRRRKGLSSPGQLNPSQP